MRPSASALLAAASAAWCQSVITPASRQCPGDAVIGAARKILRYVLLELGDAQLRPMDDFSIVGFDTTGEYFQQGRFATAVAPYQAHAFARLQRQIDVVEQGLIAEAVLKIFGLK